MKNHPTTGHSTTERTKSDFVRAVFFSAHLILLHSLNYQARRQRRLVSARTLIRRFLSPDLIKQLAPLLRQTAVCSRPDLYSNRRYPHYV